MPRSGLALNRCTIPARKGRNEMIFAGALLVADIAARGVDCVVVCVLPATVRDLS